MGFRWRPGASSYYGDGWERTVEAVERVKQMLTDEEYRDVLQEVLMERYYIPVREAKQDEARDKVRERKREYARRYRMRQKLDQAKEG